MSLSITERTVYVALDFEGLKSIERTPQEDLLLNIFNASLSNLILFKNQFVISRDMSSMFRSFQDVANQFKNDPNIFKAQLSIIIKDVPKNDRKGIRSEFEQKFSEIVKREGQDNFISRIYTGRMRIYAWPMFNDLKWYTTLNKVKKQLDEMSSEYVNTYYFLEYIKTMLAKLMICDWNPLDESLIYKRVTTLRRLLDSAISIGVEQMEPFVQELLDRSTGMEIPDTEKLLSDVFENNVNDVPFPIDSKLTLCEDKLKFDFISRGLIKFFEENIMQRKKTEKDEIWFNNLHVFLEFITERRVNRVKAWFNQNTKEFSQHNSHVVQGSNLLQEKINELKIFWNLCGIRCLKCRLHCIKQRNHDEDHDCLTDHRCSFVCQFIDQHYEQNEQQAACKHEAGHDGKHTCDTMRHLCGEPCHLRGKGNCYEYCSREVEHSDQEHLCQSTQHQCGAKCSLITEHHKCLNICVRPYDEPHGKNEHRCQNKHCPIICSMENCNERCQSKDHLHALEGEHIDHFCGGEHQCFKECQSPGICRTKYIVQKDAVYHGLRSDIPYIRYTQTSKKLPCYKKIPPNLSEHEGMHIHEEDARHTCDAKCPFCDYYCFEDYGHSKPLHNTVHGNMDHTIFSALTEEFEYQGCKLKTGDSGTLTLCNYYCKYMSRHRHINYCKDPEGHFRNENGVKHIHDITFDPDPELPKDFLSHKQFWARTGFEDPYRVIEQEEFEKCDFECPDETHKQTTSSDARPKKSYCNLPLFHEPKGTLPTGFTGYLSKDGHLFSCPDPFVAAFHIIFVSDRSGSMKKSDQKPTSDTSFGISLQKHHNNRFGAVLDATDRFIKSRINTTRNRNTSTTAVDDIVSIIIFDDVADVILENKSLLHTDSIDVIQNAIIKEKNASGTNFMSAVKRADEVIDKNFNPSRLNVIMFLSDGRSSVPTEELKRICQKNQDRGSPLYFNTVLFGNSFSGRSLYSHFHTNKEIEDHALEKMADIAQTYHGTKLPAEQRQCQYKNAIDSIQLVEHYTNVATSLLEYKPMLIKK